ncbi:MAG: hypothetical protein HY296_07985 [Thaumarchaeota archaeon]|nr:hypothetical protein [Nitrososphaerota archaeon]
MSFDASGEGAFLRPLKGKTSTFVVDSRRTNAALAKALLTEATPFFVLDIDALYSSSADNLLTGIPPEKLNTIVIRVPSPGSEIEPELASLFDGGSDVIIDSLNTLNHLLSLGDRNSRGRKLSFLVAGLSYAANQSGRMFIFSMYKRMTQTRAGRGRTLADLTDLTISVHSSNDGLRLKCERGTAWKGNSFSIPLGSAGPYRSAQRR